MKKHDEGYVLAYVVVIMAVLTTIALSVMSVSLSNLQKQRAEVERMQDKYAAEGAIEQAIEIIENIDYSLIENISLPEGVQISAVESSVSGKVCNILISAQHDTAAILCEIKVESDSEIEGTADGENKNYSLCNPKFLQYVSYKISTVQIPEGGDPSEP